MQQNGGPKITALVDFAMEINMKVLGGWSDAALIRT